MPQLLSALRLRRCHTVMKNAVRRTGDVLAATTRRQRKRRRGYWISAGPDLGHSAEEDWFLRFGWLALEHILMVAYAVRSGDVGTIRIIRARRASWKERAAYGDRAKDCLLGYSRSPPPPPPPPTSSFVPCDVSAVVRLAIARASSSRSDWALRSCDSCERKRHAGTSATRPSSTSNWDQVPPSLDVATDQLAKGKAARAGSRAPHRPGARSECHKLGP